jgi:protease secretion system outer membrane protein
MFKKTTGALRLCALGAAMALGAGTASAINLQQAYDAALKNDPTFKMGIYENEAGKESRIIGRAALLPNISASYSSTRNRVDQTQVIGGKDVLSHPQYISRGAAIQLRQPLFNMEGYARYRQGVAQSKEAEAKFEMSADEVAVRVAQAYFETLFSNDQLTLVMAERDAFVEHMKVNKRLFEKGEGTKTDMLEIQARLDLSEAKVLEAQDALTAARNTLEGLMGMTAENLAPLAPNFRIERITPATFEEWRAIALENNPELKAARLAVEVYQQEVKKIRAGHMPRLDLIATYSNNDSETISTFNQSTLNRSVGIQLNVPLYAGGQVSASSRQAAAAVERYKAELDVRTNRMLIELRKAHGVVVSSTSRVNALIKAVESGNLLMKATEQSIKGGVRINLDLLNAQQQMVTSQRDLAQARYGYLLGVLRLKAAAGTLTGADVSEIAAYFR